MALNSVTERNAIVEALKRPRFWLLLWAGLGAAGLLYVILAASFKPGAGQPSALDRSQSLLVGEMKKFQYAHLGSGAPAISFELDGERLKLADFRGRAVLVNIWATWCAPCLEELPSLDALQGRLGDEDFEVVAIAADPRGPAAARAFFDRLDIVNLKLYADPTLAFASAVGGADVMPISILYDTSGREVGRLVGGADWASPEAVRLVRSAKP